jgi:DNA polymerase-3 subunit gamma/tau
MASTPEPPDPASGAANDYVVIARRYRPQSFDELVGQQQVSQALTNAITSHRVGHAYLFTGARGVGKTSTARIFAKALNCHTGLSATPCHDCDICRGIASGSDVDVLEIDGASNRGIDEIRQLRSNVGIRPSRARFKIYIIDEVHMLTPQAFNALLKTLEEPPAHVKFMFCTTDPEKIPITVLSRCQRFDFAPVRTDSIVERLRQIVESEGAEADEEALLLLARRATGSMRDSQSLLEQLLSFCEGKVTVADVHAMLGTAGTERLAEITSRLVSRDTAGALQTLNVAVAEGIDESQLAEQLVGHFRDLMAAAVGCDRGLMLHTDTGEFPRLQETSKQLGLETILAMVELLDQSVARMRQSTQARMLLEVAFVRLCHLESLDELGSVLAELRGDAPRGQLSLGQLSRGQLSRGQPPVAQPQSEGPAREKKTDHPPNSGPASPVVTPERQPEMSDSPESIWKQTLSEFEDITSDYGSAYDRVAISAPNHLVVSFKAGYTLQKEGCERPERKARIEQVLRRITGRTIRVDFVVLPEQVAATPAQRPPSMRQRIRETGQHPFVKEAAELFDAEVTRFEERSN